MHAIIQLEQTKHAFPFGMAVEGNRLWSDSDPLDEQYRQYIFDNFNWVTLANMLKWRMMESQEVSQKTKLATLFKVVDK